MQRNYYTREALRDYHFCKGWNRQPTAPKAVSNQWRELNCGQHLLYRHLDTVESTTRQKLLARSEGSIRTHFFIKSESIMKNFWREHYRILSLEYWIWMEWRMGWDGMRSTKGRCLDGWLHACGVEPGRRNMQMVWAHKVGPRWVSSHVGIAKEVMLEWLDTFEERFIIVIFVEL